MNQARPRPHIFGLTGGAGSGKSEMAKRFEELGIPVVEADRLGHELLEPGHPVARELIDTFGEAICSRSRIDRQKLGRLVFSDSHALGTLNRITRPALLQEISRRCTALADAGHPIVVVEAAIISEDGKKDPLYEGLIVVTAPESVRIERLVAHRGMDREQARLRIEAQTPPEKKLALADWVIVNDGSLEQLRTQVDDVVRQIRERTA